LNHALLGYEKKRGKFTSTIIFNVGTYPRANSTTFAIGKNYGVGLYQIGIAYKFSDKLIAFAEQAGSSNIGTQNTLMFFNRNSRFFYTNEKNPFWMLQTGIKGTLSGGAIDYFVALTPGLQTYDVKKKWGIVVNPTLKFGKIVVNNYNYYGYASHNYERQPPHWVIVSPITAVIQTSVLEEDSKQPVHIINALDVTLKTGNLELQAGGQFQMLMNGAKQELVSITNQGKTEKYEFDYFSKGDQQYSFWLSSSYTFGKFSANFLAEYYKAQEKVIGKRQKVIQGGVGLDYMLNVANFESKVRLAYTYDKELKNNFSLGLQTKF
jgi:hypothetical protein